MMDRYRDERIVLDLKDRIGGKFIRSAKEIYLQLASLQASSKVKFDEKLQMIVPAIDELSKHWEVQEMLRDKFTVPVDLRDNYNFAMKRYMNTKINPDEFHKRDGNKRAELEKENVLLAEKIRSYEVDYAREEDEKRYEVMNERTKLTSEMAVLNYKKGKYESHLKSGASSFFVCGAKNYKAKIAEIDLRIKEIEAQLKRVNADKMKSLEDKRYQLELMHRRRWDVEKALNNYQENAKSRVGRWQNAIDNAEVVMIVRRMDIDAAIERYYASCSQKMIHAFLKVYALIKDCAATAGSFDELFRADLVALNDCAEKIYCPKISSRSVETLYKKMKLLKIEDRNQVIYNKPVKDSLPEALVKTFSVKNLKDNMETLGLFRKALPVQDRAEAVKAVEAPQPLKK